MLSYLKTFIFKAGIYSTPDYISKSVSQLIEKMLTVDPLKRATIKDIREHDWFKIDLSDYLFPKPTNENLNLIDIEAIHEICEVYYN
jgi:5'-AMP-activated protein kinase catalytic alpha subunit